MEDKIQETQETPVLSTVEAIKTELEEEKKAKATAEAALAEKDALIADIQA
jgi:hypothetical protein